MQLILEDSAKIMLDEYFLENPAPQCIRIGLRNACGVTGNTMCMRPDKQTARDISFEAKGYTFVILRSLAEQVGEWVRIDTKEHGGFVVTTANPVEAVACEIKGEKVQDKPMECML
ncbi:adhesin [Desulfovibrio sp. OttesenSCG-928-C06]|nr:adhesin [Desulfovibrio sp. OttesenSCG-928-C06]